MYLDTFERIDAFAATAIRTMRESGIAPTPRNFTVCFEYHSGRNPALSRIIDTLLSNQREIDDATLGRLYDRFLASPNEYSAMRETSQRMQQALTELLGLIEHASDDTSRFGARLRDVSGDFAARKCSVVDLIQRLLLEAREMADRTDQLAAHLQERGEMIRDLQKNLEDARREAVTDGLTGLFNRRHFDTVLRQMAAEAMNTGHALALLLIDIDHFKSVNDKWGHVVGDQVIQLASATIRRALRKGDVAARYGGEEFAMLLPETALPEAARIGERVRAAFEGHQIVARGSRHAIGTITVSGGLALYEAGLALVEWVRRADAALYEAKATGRNRLVTACTDGADGPLRLRHDAACGAG